MTVARRKGDAGMADILAARIVRSRGVCEWPSCNRTDVVWAHIIRRSKSAGVRCVEDNAWALCPTHHDLVDNWPDEHQALVVATIGMDRYHELKRIGAAYTSSKVPAGVFWSEEVARLKARCRELGLSDRRTG